MTKTTSSKKKSKPDHEGKAVEQEKASSKRKKMGSEIDDIFAEKKRNKLEMEKNGESEKPAKVVSSANMKSRDKTKIGKSSKHNSLEESSTVDRTSRWRKKTADGLAIYTEEELGIGKPRAGGTALCPFDCDCCF